MRSLKQKFRNTFSYAVTAYIVIGAIIIGLLTPAIASAAALANRQLTLSTSAGNTSATWTFQFDGASGSVLQGITFQVCDAPSGTCNIPGSWTNAGSSFSSLTYNGTPQSGWTIDNAAGYLRIHNASASNTSANPIVVTFNTVTNPNTTNATFYVRTNTYTNSTYSAGVDSGVVAASTAQQISLSASVDEALTFCVGTSGVTSSSCSGATGSSINFGSLSASSTASGLSQFGVGTNGQSGYSVTVNGTSLTCGGCIGTPSIAALASQTASTTGAEQFGLNLRANGTPSVGVDPDGSGAATPTGNYNTVNQYRFVTGDSVAGINTSDLFRRFQVSYIVNINTATKAGSYNAVMTYICTAKF